jgi:hypothetical protein
MRLYGAGSISTPALFVLNAFLVIVVLLIAAEILVVSVLLVDPLHPIRQHFQATTIATVPAEVWPPGGVVHVEPGIAAARVDPWAYIRYQPASRWFVAVTAALSLSWWACVFLMLLYLRRAFNNLSGGTPFPRNNIRCIRGTGLAILGMAAVDLISDGVGLGFISATTTVAGRPVVIPSEVLLMDFPLGTILAGLAVVILAEVFRAGADLQDDQALTV